MEQTNSNFITTFALFSLPNVKHNVVADSRKRSAADLASQRDAAASLVTDAKRLRSEITSVSQCDDDELLELALQDVGGNGNLPGAVSASFRAGQLHHKSGISQSSQLSGAGRTSHRPATENFEELDMLLEMDPSQTTATQRERESAPARTAAAAAPLLFEEDEDQEEEKEAQQLPTNKQALDTMIPLRPYLPPLREAINVQGESITVTSSSGERVYAPVVDAQGGVGSASTLDIAGALRRARGTLLSSGIDDLMQQVERDQFERALMETTMAGEREKEKEAAVEAAKAAEQHLPNRSSKKQRLSGSTTSKKESEAAKSTSSLWVEKYAPKGFLDLLSDEQINRDVVKWLKTWDTCVFGAREQAPGVAAAAAAAAASRGGGRGGYKSGFSGGKKYGANAGAEHEDQFGRPQYKAILLCGPPGLGKTTLAHVVARHCGYRPVEINASDDRSGATLTGRVLDAVQMQSVMGERLPNCLIIDEIDGASGGAEGRSGIAALVKIITATGSSSSRGKKGGGGGGGPTGGKGQHHNGGGGDDDDESEDDDDDDDAVVVNGNGSAFKGKGAKPLRGGGGNANGILNGRGGGAAAATGRGGGVVVKQKARPLLRPIICICNDLYAPALRPLRDVAKVFHFRKPSADRLAHRLQMVCAAEGLRAEKSTLRMLAERAECDVRSCMNTLQFLSKRQKIVRQVDVAGVGVGQKDMTKGAFQVWGELLQKKKAPNIIGKVPENDVQRSARLYNMLMDFGDSDLIVRGLFESLPALRFFDMGLQRTTQVLGNIQDADAMMRCAMRSGDFGLLKYMPASALRVSMLVAQPERPTIAWPRTGGEVHRRTLGNEALLHQWMLKMSPSTFAALGAGATILDVLPMLPALTAPALRPVSRHLFSREEQACVDGLVGTLLSFGLKFSLQIEDLGEGENEEESGFLTNNHHINQSSSASSGEPPLQFYPPIHRLWHFRGKRDDDGGAAAPRRSLAMATRQMVLHETEMEAIRRADAARQASAAAATTANNVNFNTSGAVDMDTAGGGEGTSTQQQQQQQVKKTSHVPLNLAQRLQDAGIAGKIAKANANAKKAPKGTWLDQLRDQQYAIKTAAASAAAANGGFAAGAARFPVLYKFHEGYTNAVKRPLLMSELL